MDAWAAPIVHSLTLPLQQFSMLLYMQLCRGRFYGGLPCEIVYYTASVRAIVWSAPMSKKWCARRRDHSLHVLVRRVRIGGLRSLHFLFYVFRITGTLNLIREVPDNQKKASKDRDFVSDNCEMGLTQTSISLSKNCLAPFHSRDVLWCFALLVYQRFEDKVAPEN